LNGNNVPDSQNHSTGRFVERAVSKIVFTYAAFAALWILLSDQLVIVVFSDPKSIALINTIKGWLFVAVTSFLLALMVRRYLNKLSEVNDQVGISEERWKFALEGAGDGVWDWNIQTGDAHFSKRWKEMLGFAENEITNSSAEWSDRVHPEDLQRVMTTIQEHIDGNTPSAIVEFRMQCKDGSWRWILGRGMVVGRSTDGKAIRLVGTNSDITDRKQIGDQVQQLAFYDPLTNLPNRRLLNDRLGQAMAANKRSGCYGALMFLDLDNFKPLNDEHGHEVGDLLLIEVATRLTNCVRQMDTVARFGGDEFVVVTGELETDKAESSAQAGIIAEKIRSTLSEPYLLTIKNEGKADLCIEHHCTVSIGVALFSNHEASQGDILKWADKAMYQAKEIGRNTVRFSDSIA